MTIEVAERPSAAPSAPDSQAPPRHRRRWRLRLVRRRPWLTSWPLGRVIVATIAVLGIAVMLYPSAAAWFAQRVQGAQVDAYVQAIESMSPDDVRAELRQAHRYNDHLETGAVGDPFAFTTGANKQASGDGTDGWKKYRQALDVGAGGVMGVVRIPTINAELPIYHGTDAATLDRGVGHLYGTTLPVGGRGTHAVLTGHSGLIHSTLFTHLEDVRLGDRFTVTVVDRVLTYEVDDIRTVLPTETDFLTKRPNGDLVTLITCTPTGVNTHRLLVTGHRVPTDEAAVPGTGAITGGRPSNFPWWIVYGTCGLLGCVVVTAPLARRAPGHRGSSCRGGTA